MILDEPTFISEVLPKYKFKASKITSIQRNLNIYGFQRLVRGEHAGAYVHPIFHRDMDPADLLNRVVRRGTNGNGGEPLMSASPSSCSEYETTAGPVVEAMNGLGRTTRRDPSPVSVAPVNFVSDDSCPRFSSSSASCCARVNESSAMHELAPLLMAAAALAGSDSSSGCATPGATVSSALHEATCESRDGVYRSDMHIGCAGGVEVNHDRQRAMSAGLLGKSRKQLRSADALNATPLATVDHLEPELYRCTSGAPLDSLKTPAWPTSATCSAKLKQERAAPFPVRLHEMISAESKYLPYVVAWLEGGHGFMILDEPTFISEVLPKYKFKASKITSIQRNLNIYGFQRLVRGEHAGAYVHPIFHRDMDPVDLDRITRRDSTPGGSPHLSSLKPEPLAASASKPPLRGLAIDLEDTSPHSGAGRRRRPSIKGATNIAGKGALKCRSQSKLRASVEAAVMMDVGSGSAVAATKGAHEGSSRTVAPEKTVCAYDGMATTTATAWDTHVVTPQSAEHMPASWPSIEESSDAQRRSPVVRESLPPSISAGATTCPAFVEAQLCLIRSISWDERSEERPGKRPKSK